MGSLNGEKKLQVDESHNKKEKIENSLKNYMIKSLQTICYKLAALRNIIHSIFTYKLMRPVSILGPLKKNRQKERFQIKNLARKVSKTSKMKFSVKFFFLIKFLTALGFFFLAI